MMMYVFATAAALIVGALTLMIIGEHNHSARLFSLGRVMLLAAFVAACVPALLALGISRFGAAGRADEQDESKNG